jgi:hypothetical protein
MINYCKTCVNPSTRPNTFFNDEGLCPVCVYETEKIVQKVDWSDRWEEIQKFINIEPKDTEVFCNWLGIEKNKLFE